MNWFGSWSHEDVGLLILFVTVALAGLWLGYLLAYFEVGFPYPPGYVKKKLSFFDRLLRFFGLERVKEVDELPVPLPPASSPLPVEGLKKGVILSADYDSHELKVPKPPSPSPSSLPVPKPEINPLRGVDFEND